MSLTASSGSNVFVPMTASGIYRKLHAIMSDANYIQKDKKNPFHGYKYASEAVIKEKLHELFVKHGVIPVFSVANHRIEEAAPTNKGNRQFRTTLDLNYRFVDISDGSSVEGTMPGCGIDGEDKGTYKAITGALKYCLTSQFVIPTGDDPEAPNEKEKETVAEPVTLVPAPPPTPALLVETKVEPSQYISQNQKSYMARRFREALRPEVVKDAEELRHQALIAIADSKRFKSQLIDIFGNPTSDYITVDEYGAIGKVLIEAAKLL